MLFFNIMIKSSLFHFIIMFICNLLFHFANNISLFYHRFFTFIRLYFVELICSFLLFLKMSLIYSFYELVNGFIFCELFKYWIIKEFSPNLLLKDRLSHFNTFFISTIFIYIYFPNTFIFLY